MQSLGIYIILSVIFLTSFALDITGFVERVPPKNRINGISFRHPDFPSGSGFITDTNSNPIFKSEENIDAFREFHRNIIENHINNNDHENSRNSFYQVGNVRYFLNGVFDMYRSYSLNYGYIKDNNNLAKIFESKEYKSLFSLSNVDISNLSSITVRNPSVSTWRAITNITVDDKMRELLAYVELDFKAQTYGEAISNRNMYVRLSLNYITSGINNVSNVSIPRSYKNAIGWLKDNNYAQDIEITPDMISMIKIYKRDKYRSKGMPSDSNKILDITDKEQFAIILDTYETKMYTEEPYEGRIIFEPDSTHELDEIAIYYSEETLPLFINKELLQ